MALHTFDSGLKVIQHTDFSEDALVRKIVALAAAEAPLTDLSVSLRLEIPLALANQHLVLSEQRLLLCRDESLVDGLQFFANIFAA